MTVYQMVSKDKQHKKLKLSVRLSPDAADALKRYSEKWYCKNPSEALEKFIRRWKYLDDFGATQQLPSDELTCISRIKYEGEFFCVFRPPRMKHLETLDICAVCKKRRLGLNEKSLLSPREGIFIPQTEPQTENRADDHQAIRDPNKKHEGMRYCKNGGLWVFPTKCEICRTKTYAQYDNCQKQKAAV